MSTKKEVNMTPSDWTAIGIAVTSLIISLVGFWLNYKTNQDNIKARRAEIVTEKSIEVYREFVEILNNISNILWSMVLFDESESEISKANTQQWREKAADAMVNCLHFLDKYRIYFPTTIHGDFIKIFTRWGRVPDEADENVDKLMTSISSDVKKLIERIQRHIGVDIK